MHIRNILVPTDFSESSENAISFALELAIKLEARLFLVHSIQTTFSMGSQRLLDQLQPDRRLEKVEVRTITEIGDPATSILTQSSKVEADLILIGSKGSSGTRKLMGSTTTEVIAKSDIPVLAIPVGTTYSDFEDIVFMTDLRKGDFAALEKLIKWADYFDARLNLLHLLTADSKQERNKFRGFKNQVKDQMTYDKLNFEQFSGSSFSKGFLNYMKHNTADLIALTRYNKTFFQNLVERDHARQIGYESLVPFLTLPAE